MLALPAQAESVRLYWDAALSGGSPLATYVVVWGTSPGVYTQSQVVPATQLTAEILNLSPGVPRYFAVRAVDTTGTPSGYSNELLVILPATVGTVTRVRVPRP